MFNCFQKDIWNSKNTNFFNQTTPAKLAVGNRAVEKALGTNL